MVMEITKTRGARTRQTRTTNTNNEIETRMLKHGMNPQVAKNSNVLEQPAVEMISDLKLKKI